MKDGSLLIYSFNIISLFYRNLFQNGPNNMSKMVNMQIAFDAFDYFVPWDHPILSKFHQLMENIFIKELQIFSNLNFQY